MTLASQDFRRRLLAPNTSVMRSLLLALAALFALSLAAPVSAAPPENERTPKQERPADGRGKKAPRPVTGPLRATIGIADQKADLFGDRRFQGLGIKHVRRSIPWDAMRYGWQVAELDHWLNAAQAAGVTPLITFARSRHASRRHIVPTPDQVIGAFRAFRQRYPWVTEFAASNESNHGGEPTHRRPDLAARYYVRMKRACVSCKILAADLLDIGNMAWWVRRFIRAAGHQPRYWGFHNYVSANRFQTKATRTLLRLTTGQIWFTEVGGLVKRRSSFRGKVKLKEGSAHAAKVTRFIFQRLARLSPRIKRVYLYHWNAEGPRSSWDSGLVGSDGRPRPAFGVLQAQVRAQRAAR